jgi:serine/threonine protein kinase
VLAELVKVDLEQRAAAGRLKLLEYYIAEFPEILERGEPPCDLIYEEFHVRRTAGHEVSLSDYCRRFPGSADALKRLIATADVTVTTQIQSPTSRVDGIEAGQRLDDFDLLVELGKGAFASVYLARQISMQRLVALKVSADRGSEPQTLAQLDHPNIVRVYDQRQLGEQRIRLLYMQYAPGGTLADVVRRVRETPAPARSGAILVRAVSEAQEKAGAATGDEASWKRRAAASTWPEMVSRLGVQLAQALDHAHKQGILHRDVKPANVLMAGDGTPKLADFNISFCSQLEGASPAAYFGGSLAYMSPEQLEAVNPHHDRQAADLDGRSDLYSLAVVLWELLYGERPFADVEMAAGWSATLATMADRRRTLPPAAPPGPRDAVAQRLEFVLRKSLSSQPAERHADGTALARDLSLCTNPRAWSLIHDLGSGWREWARRYPVLALFPVNLPPFVLASAYNFYYNRDEFIRKQTESPEVLNAFWTMFYPVNFLLFPLGMFLVLYYGWPVGQTIRNVARGEPVPDEQLRMARQRSLNLGHWIAGVGLALWVAAGVAFPVGIHLLAGDFPWQGYRHFFLSMLLCGLISCCFPFLATTWLCVRVFFPALLASSSPDPGEQRQLIALSKQAGVYLVATVIVPLLAMLLLIISGSDSQKYTVTLIAASVVGFIAAYLTYHRIRDDLAALTIATRPADLVGTSTDSVDSF